MIGDYCYPQWTGTTKVGSRGRGSVCFNWYYNIRRIYYGTLTPPNNSGGDKPTPLWRICLSSIHLVGVDCSVLVARELVGAITTVVGWMDSVGPTIELVADSRRC